MRNLRLFCSALALSGMTFSLNGCGFQPLYGEQSQKGAADVSAELKRVYVANIPERTGQQLRLALQQNMAGAGPEAPDGYTLYVSPYFGEEAIDIHADNTSGRTRINAHAHWQLMTVAEHPVLLAQGDATSLDGYTAVYEQYFAQTMNNETALGRVAQALGDQITQQVAIWFRTQTKPAQGASQQGPKTYYPLVNTMPNNSDQGDPQEEAGADAIPNMATGRSPTNGNSQ